MKREVRETSTDIILQNQVIIDEIRKMNEDLYMTSEKKKLAHIVTYGCQMNEHDSEKLTAMIEQMGYDQTFAMEDADLVIFNTCCVRENAELKVFGNLGHVKSLKRKNPSLILAVCGCMMQQSHIVEEIKSKYSHVDLVFGTHNVHNFPKLMMEVLQGHHQVIEVWDVEGEIIEGLSINRKYGTKAYVNIMYGCNNFCTYCIVPYTRGRERSRDPQVILDEIKELVASGVKEVTVLGQNVNSYGKTLENPIDFADLLRLINEIDGLERIRFMTSHPKDISKKLIDTMAECDKVCEQLHLPVQSGSDRVLKRMNRRYTTEAYLETVKYAKAKIPNLAISTDLIIGFPGETDEDIDHTIAMIKEVEYNSAFTFIYSVRKGTPAAEYDDQIPEDIKHQRFERVLEAVNESIIKKHRAFKDQIVEVLVEGESRSNPEIMMGRTRGFDTVNFPGDVSMTGKIVKVKITNPKKFSLSGEIVE